MPAGPLRIFLSVLCLLAAMPALAAEPALVPQIGHAERITGLAYSVDRLVSGSMDDTVRVWERSSGVLMRILEAHQRGVTCVAVAPNGWMVASGGHDGSIVLWDIGQGMQLQRLEGASADPVRALGFTPDSMRVVAATSSQVWLWDARGGVLLHSAKSPTEVRSLAVSPRGDVVAVGVVGTGLRPLAVEMRELHALAMSRGLTAAMAPPRGHVERPVTAEAVAFSPDGQWVGAATHDGRIEVWDAETTAPRESLDAGGPMRTVAFSPDGAVVGAGGEHVGLWAVSSGLALRRDLGTGGDVGGLAFAPDGSSYAAGRADGRIEIWDAHAARLVSVLLPSGLFRMRPVVLVDGTLAGAGARGDVGVAWDGSTGAHRLQGAGPWLHMGVVAGIVAAGTGAGGVEAWSAGDGRKSWSAVAHRGPVTSLAVAGGLVASGGDDRMVHLFDGADGAVVRSLHGGTAWPTALALAPDGSLLVEGGWDRGIHVWDVRGGRLALRLDAPDAVNALAVSGDARVLAAACGASGHRGVVGVWTLRGGAPPHLLECGEVAAAVVALSWDGAVVAAGGDDGVLRVWSAGSVVARVPAHGSGVAAVRLSSDGAWVVTAGRDGLVRLWESATGRLRMSLAVGLRDGVPRWLAWDARGHYTGSEGAEGMMRWTVEGASLPGEAFRERLWRPSLRLLLDAARSGS